MKNIFWLIPMTLLVASCASNDMAASQQSSATPIMSIVANTASDCQMLDKDFTPYQSTRAQVSFCYPKAWGEVKEMETSVSPEARTGTNWEISFPEEPNGLTMYYYTNDFKLTGDRDAGPMHDEINWTAINPAMDSGQLAKALHIPNATIKTIEKADRNNKFGIHVSSDFIDPLGEDHIQSVYWMYPHALKDQMSLVVGGNFSEKIILEKIVNSLRF